MLVRLMLAGIWEHLHCNTLLHIIFANIIFAIIIFAIFLDFIFF